MRPRQVFGFNHFRQQLRGNLQGIMNLHKFSVRKHDLSIDQLQYTLEDQIRVPDYFQQMLPAGAVCSGEPVLRRPLIGSSPSHQGLDRLMTAAKLSPQGFRDR